MAVGPWRGRGEEEVAAVVLAAAAGGEDERERWRFLLAVILLLLTDISRNDDLDSIAVLMYYLKLWILDTYRPERIYVFFIAIVPFILSSLACLHIDKTFGHFGAS